MSHIVCMSVQALCAWLGCLAWTTEWQQFVCAGLSLLPEVLQDRRSSAFVSTAHESLAASSQTRRMCSTPVCAISELFPPLCCVDQLTPLFCLFCLSCHGFTEKKELHGSAAWDGWVAVVWAYERILVPEHGENNTPEPSLQIYLIWTWQMFLFLVFLSAVVAPPRTAFLRSRTRYIFSGITFCQDMWSTQTGQLIAFLLLLLNFDKW